MKSKYDEFVLFKPIEFLPSLGLVGALNVLNRLRCVKKFHFFLYITRHLIKNMTFFYISGGPCAV